MTTRIAALVVGLILLSAPAAQGQDWERHVIDYEAGENIGEYCSMAIDGNHIVIAYFFDEPAALGHLRVADYTGGAWTISIADDEDLSDGKYASIAFDPTDGHPAIVHRAYAGTNYFLKYAKFNGTAWDLEEIPLPDGVTNANGTVGKSLSFTPDGTAQVLWFTSGTSDMYLSSRESGTWTHDLIEDDGYLGPAGSLIHDSDDQPWIVYFLNSGAHDRLLSAYNDGTWNFDEVYGSGNNIGDYNSLAHYAPTNHIVAAFREGAYTKTYQWDPGSSSWTRFGTSTPPGNLGLNEDNSCAFDAEGTYAVAHYDNYGNCLRYAYWNGSSWRRTIVDDTHDVGQYCSLAFYNDTTAVIACYDADDEALVLYADGDLGQSGAVDPVPRSCVPLLQTVPNPFGPARGAPGAIIRFSLDSESRVSLRVFDVSGQLVRELLTLRTVGAGHHGVSWNGRDHHGNPLPSGIYLYRLDLEDRAVAGRALLVR